MYTSNLFVYQDLFNKDYNINALFFISLAAIIFGINVTIRKNPINSILNLIGLFVTISLYLMLLGLNFIGLSYLLVYVGAVSILFLFILMLINVRISELSNYNLNSIPLAILICSLLCYSLFTALGKYNIVNITNYYTSKFFILNLSNISVISNTSWDSNLIEISHIYSLGNVLYCVYPILFILSGLILLLALSGAVVLCLKT